MARRGSARRRWLGRGSLPAGLVSVAVAASLVAGCTSEQSGPDAPTDAALRVTTHGSGLDEGAKARLESEVGDVLARYVRDGFLGEYPRTDFVQTFADFSSGAAEEAVGDIDVLTAARFATATSVHATDLAAELAPYVVDGEAVGATAWIDFSFDVVGGGSPKTVELAGRLVLDQQHGRWSVFAYDVHRHDSDAMPTEAAS